MPQGIDITETQNQVTTLEPTDVLTVARPSEAGDRRYKGIPYQDFLKLVAGSRIVIKDRVPTGADIVEGIKVIFIDSTSRTLYFHDGVPTHPFYSIAGGGGGTNLTKATQAQAEAGTDDTAYMTPLSTKQAIATVKTRHLIRFSAQDADTVPEADLQSGEIGIYQGSTQLQATDIAVADTFYFPKKAANIGQNPTNPGTNLTAYDLEPLFRDVLDNPGSSILIALADQAAPTTMVWFQINTITAYGTTGFKGTDVVHIKGNRAAASGGVGWNVAAGITQPIATKDIIDKSKLVFRTDLEGHDTDKYASYNNALIGAGYRSGDFCLFTGTTQPTNARAIGQPSIASGSGVVAFGRLRTDKDPNVLVWDVVPAASDYPNGRVIHATVEGKNPGHVRITLTSAGTLVGTGDAAYVWAQASWVEIGDVGPQDEGDWWKLSEFVPSGLDVRIPWTDIVDAPDFLEKSGAGAGTTAVTQESLLPVRAANGEYEDKSVAHMGDHIRPQLTAPRILEATYETTLSDVDAGDGKINVGAISGGSATVTWGLRDTESLEGGGSLPKDDIISILTLHHRITVYAGTKVFKGTITGYGGGGASYPYQVTVSEATKDGAAFADVETIKIKLESAIPDRDELADQSYLAETPSIAGKGGSAGKIWAWVSSATNAAWVSIVSVLLDAFAPSRADSDRGKALILKADDKDALALVSVPAVPVQLLNVTTASASTWTSVTSSEHTLTDESEFEARLVGLAASNRRIVTAKFRLGDLDTNAYWLPWGAGAAAGFRIQFRRQSAGVLQYQKQPSTFATFRLRLFLLNP